MKAEAKALLSLHGLFERRGKKREENGSKG